MRTALVGGVHTLAAVAGGAIHVYAQSSSLMSMSTLVGLGQHGHRDGGGVNASAGLRLGTRCTRCTPLSKRMVPYTLSPES
jgi:hypothetical protein